MNRLSPTAVEAFPGDARGAQIATAERRFRMIRQIKARARAERALGLSPDQILRNTREIEGRALARLPEELKEAGRILAAIAFRATADALAEPAPTPPPFDRWLTETIRENRERIRFVSLPAPSVRDRERGTRSPS